MNLTPIINALRHVRPQPGISETQLHAQIMLQFEKFGLTYTHEVVLARGCRIDFLVYRDGLRIGVEVKRGKPSRSAVARQLERPDCQNFNHACAHELYGDQVLMFKEHKVFPPTQDQMYDFVDANDPSNGGTDFSLVKLEPVNMGRSLILRPHCTAHGSMNRVSGERENDYGLWRCLFPGCRSACIQKSKPVHGFDDMIDSVTRKPLS